MAASPTPPPTTYPDPAMSEQPLPPTRGRPMRRAAAALAVLAMGAGAAVFVRVTADPEPPKPRPYRFVVPDVAVHPGATAPDAPPAAGPDRAAWVAVMADKTDMPARTVEAYLRAEDRAKVDAPTCKLTWVTLAGVGRVESHHGLYNGTKVTPTGDLSKPIVGVPLDGSPGVKAIPDSDQGRLDGDLVWDRAVGSMQFLPTTWARWAQRANGDGQPANPQNVDDAALTAARYLCASGGDLSTGPGWWKAVLTYNASTKYGRDVFSGADAYVKKAVELTRTGN
ncbi:lytic transglycosylase domain-containing protein [Actinokineospora pegani]|uniref:lytic transglycosylase domain-containing protein n=1 Tax=Actinokineospora pegani TaxID=2654637 RepID=UPI001F2A1FEF|nr:lytic murein transglycosylase [Actinokineospora pegani]